ncbi:MAG: AI-2E family transporter [Clostridia bacterium]|nr:AI-2E family transporter [Clostridia bacterium]
MKKKLKDFFTPRILTIIIVALICIVSYIVLLNFSEVRQALSKFYGYISPIVSGFIIAYLLNPAVVFFRDVCFKRIRRRSTANALAVTVTVILILALLVTLMAFVIPELYSSIKSLFVNIDDYMAQFKTWISNIFSEVGFSGIDVDKFFGNWENVIHIAIEWLNVNSDTVIGITQKAGGALLDFIISALVAVYLLFDKKRLVKGINRTAVAFMKPETYERTKITLKKINIILSKFITSELIDMCIIGFSNYIFMLIFGMPYPLLISIIVALTNLIPNFGPFIGGIPSALLILIIDPMSAILFAIWITGMQFLDGNFIKPMLIGDSLGLSPALVLISIVVGGNMFGIPGMVLGVPAVALISYFVEERIKKIEAAKLGIEYVPDAIVEETETYEKKSLAERFRDLRETRKLKKEKRKKKYASKPVTETNPTEEPVVQPPVETETTNDSTAENK